MLLPESLLMFLVVAAALAMVPDTNCPDKCGNMSIPYPFGIGKGCFREGFEINCTKDSDGFDKPYIRENTEVITVSIVAAQASVYQPIAFACYDRLGNQKDESSGGINLTGTPYRLSYTRNKFTAVGCGTFAYSQDFSLLNFYLSGCQSICKDMSSVTDGAPCSSGMGCCQTPFPKGHQFYEVVFAERANPYKQQNDVWSFNPCSYAFLTDQEWYVFNSSDVKKSYLIERNKKGVPLVLDWAIGTETCEQAKNNLTVAYACLSENSNCLNSSNGDGYTCICSDGYQGNPYKKEGCQDINECEDKMKYQCYGQCTNFPGSFNCSCPSGTRGDHTRQGGCQRQATLPLFAKILIGGVCTILFSVVMHLVYEKSKLIRAKQKYFRHNGGLFLQEQIKQNKYHRFKIFSAEEIRSATNNFNPNRVRGQGGQGTVYEGIIDDKRIVAVKKAVNLDERLKKIFLREMYILSLINHKNVIKILGCCLEVEVPMLVYEFISGGTLSQRIQDKNRSMSLDFRLKVAVDCASALAYLHSDASSPILHRDVKSSNILLIDNDTAKLSDFGASVLPPKHTLESGVPGTFGYIDPESLQKGELTAESDVYSFAVVILELLTRKTAVYSEGPSEKRNLAQTFKENGLENILDEEIKNQVTKEQIDEFSGLLTECLKENGKERPTMTKVLAWLTRMREINQNLSEHSMEDIEPGHGDTNYHTTTTEYYSPENQLAF